MKPTKPRLRNLLLATLSSGVIGLALWPVIGGRNAAILAVLLWQIFGGPWNLYFWLMYRDRHPEVD